MIKKVTLWLIVFSIFWLVNSCGARKSESIKKEESVKMDYSGTFQNSGNSQEILTSDFNLSKWTVSNVSDQKDVETEETTIEPRDVSKPAYYTDPNGKKYILENTKIVNKKTKDKSKTNSGNSGNSEEFLKTKLENKSEQKSVAAAKLKAEAEKKGAQKQTSREGFSLWNLFWLLIPVVLYVTGRRLWEKYKKVNPLV